MIGSNVLSVGGTPAITRKEDFVAVLQRFNQDFAHASDLHDRFLAAKQGFLSWRSTLEMIGEHSEENCLFL